MKKLLMLLLILIINIGVINAANINKPDELLDTTLETPYGYIPNYRQEARDIITTFAKFAKSQNKEFEMFIFEGRKLLTKEDWEYDLEEYWDAKKYGLVNEDEAFLHNLFNRDRNESLVGSKTRLFLKNIDGVILDNLYCGNRPLTPKQQKAIKDHKLTIVSVEKCKDGKKLLKAKQELAKKKIPVYGYVNENNAFSHIPTSREFFENADNISTSKQAKNFLYQKYNNNYSSKGVWLEELRNNNLDIIIIDPFYDEHIALKVDEVNSLKYKKNGMRRRVFARMSITEAKDTRYYWNDEWQIGNPSFLRVGSYNNDNSAITDYWDQSWKKIIGEYFKSITDLGFDGVVIEDIDNHKYFEKLTPID